MKRLLIIGSIMFIVAGAILISCWNIERTNVYDPASPYYEKPTVIITPAGDKNVYYCGGQIQFTASGGIPPYTWTIVEKDKGGCAAPPYAYENATLSTTGLFKADPMCMGCTPSYCKVKVTDSKGNTATSGEITITMTP